MALRRSPTARVGDARLGNPAYQAYWLLRIGFAVAPILFGLDKFFHVLVDWDQYLAGPVDDVLPGSAHTAMLVVGGIEIAAGLLVAVAPRIGGYVVAAWLASIVTNLLIEGDYYDIALRDFGLLVGALSLARLATAFPGVGGRPATGGHGRSVPASPGEPQPASASAVDGGWEQRELDPTGRRSATN